MAEPNWLDEDEDRTWRSVAGMMLRLPSALERQLVRQSGLSTAEFSLLVPLSEAPERRLRARDLRLAVGWDRSRLAHQVGRMERRGLLRRHECCTDARGTMVELTEQGLRAIEGAAPGHVEAVRRYFIDLLSPDERETIRIVADRVLGRIAAEPCGPDGERPGRDL